MYGVCLASLWDRYVHLQKLQYPRHDASCSPSSGMLDALTGFHTVSERHYFFSVRSPWWIEQIDQNCAVRRETYSAPTSRRLMSLLRFCVDFHHIKHSARSWTWARCRDIVRLLWLPVGQTLGVADAEGALNAFCHEEWMDGDSEDPLKPTNTKIVIRCVPADFESIFVLKIILVHSPEMALRMASLTR